jgi:phage portal protein BeeE
MLQKLLSRATLGSPESGLGANETTAISVYDWGKMFAPGSQLVYNGTAYQAYKPSAAGPGADSYAAATIVYMPAAIRISLFAEARFQWQRLVNGKPGDLFGNADLQILEEPWPGHTTADLLRLAEVDVLANGNSYWVRNGDFLQRLDPKNVKLIYGKVFDQSLTGYSIGDTLIGYAYEERKDQVTVYEPQEVCHYKPHPSGNNQFLGMSWLSPCLPDVETDQVLSQHKQSVIKNGATLSTIVTFDESVSPETGEAFIDSFYRTHVGAQYANKPLFIGGGADVKTVGQTFENLALQSIQNSGEVRVAACAGVPPAIVGVSEGLKGSSLNAGNYGEARKRLSDVTMRPLWRDFAGAMTSLLPPPGNARLWYDVADIAFLREDSSDAAQILETNSTSILKLIQAGYEPDAAVAAVTSGDLTRLNGTHTGLFSVQLQPPGDGTLPNPDVATPELQPGDTPDGNAPNQGP